MTGALPLQNQDDRKPDQPQRILVSEFVCGGAWPFGIPDGSLAAEGRAMLIALIEDLLRIPNVEVTTTWDARLEAFPLPESPQLTVSHVTTPDQESCCFTKLAILADSAIVIAPETDGILAERSRTAVRTGCQLIGCTPAAIERCTNKLTLAETLQLAGIAHIPTAELDLNRPEPAWPYPLVIKPRDGAGSQLTFLITDSASLAARVAEITKLQPESPFIQQPFVSGQPASAAAIVPDLAGIFPAGVQVLSNDGRFDYLGCDLPGSFGTLRQEQVKSIIQCCTEVLPGLSGYVGFDLIIPDDVDKTPVLVEINPRLTTGYLAWRQWTSENLAERMVRPSIRPRNIDWGSDPIQFRMSDLV